DGLDQARAEHRRRDAEDDVVLRNRGGEVVLSQVAARGVAGSVAAAGDGEEGVNAAIALEARLADRAGRGDERRDGVAGAEGGRQRDLRVPGRRRATGGRLHVTATAAIEVEGRPEPVVEVLDLVEGVLAEVEQRLLRRAAAGKD